MSKEESAKDYWNVRSDLFANYYVKPSKFDLLFRRGIYTRAAVAMEVIRGYKQSTVIDVGSGPGVNSVNWLKNSDISFLTGIDFAEAMITYSNELIEREGLAGRAKFIQGDFLTFDFQDQKFDVSVAMGVFDYVENSLMLLEKMGAVSNKAVVASWPRNGLRMALRRYRYTCPLFHYDEQQVIRMHRDAGLPSVEIMSSSKSGFTTCARKG